MGGVLCSSPLLAPGIHPPPAHPHPLAGTALAAVAAPLVPAAATLAGAATAPCAAAAACTTQQELCVKTTAGPLAMRADVPAGRTETVHWRQCDVPTGKTPSSTWCARPPSQSGGCRREAGASVGPEAHPCVCVRACMCVHGRQDIGQCHFAESKLSAVTDVSSSPGCTMHAAHHAHHAPGDQNGGGANLGQRHALLIAIKPSQDHLLQGQHTTDSIID